jgi:hypothetical protein
VPPHLAFFQWDGGRVSLFCLNWSQSQPPKQLELQAWTTGASASSLFMNK